MKKYIVFACVIVMLLIGGLVYQKNKSETPSHYFKQLQNELSSYEIAGTLELVDDEALKTIKIQSMYKQIDDQDYYYVRLEDMDTHQVQTIVKNNEGIFVLAQGFNRAFQFKSEWPNNGFKPYIIDNIISLFSENFQEDKIRDGYVITAPISDPTHPNAKQTQILFNQNLAMTQVNLLDEDGNELIQFEISTYILNPEIDDSIFTLNSQEDVEVSIQEALPLYPLESYETELIDQLKTSDGHILRYKGDKYFTLIQNALTVSNMFDVEYINGDFYAYEDGLIFFQDNQAMIIKDGIQTTLYSKDLTQEEQMNILLSLENSIVIEP